MEIFYLDCYGSYRIWSVSLIFLVQIVDGFIIISIVFNFFNIDLTAYSYSRLEKKR